MGSTISLCAEHAISNTDSDFCYIFAILHFVGSGKNTWLVDFLFPIFPLRLKGRRDKQMQLSLKGFV